MEHFEKYKRRLERKGSSYKESMIDSSKKIVRQKFSTSPSHALIMVNEINTEGIVTNKTDSYDKEVLFLPEQEVYIGDIVKYKNDNYLTMEFFENEVYPKAEMRLCNSTFPIQTNKTRVLIGHDDFGKPIYKEESTTIPTPCIIESRYAFTRGEQQISLPDNRIEIMLKYTDSESLYLDTEFTLRDGTYKIKNIDYSQVIKDKGILVISAERQVS